MFSPELQAKISLWRQKSADGTITDAELREAVTLLRGERKTATVTSAKRKKAAVEVKSADDMLNELGI